MRFTLQIAGQSGSGLLSTGDILMKALKKKGFYLCADREYPSLIKGGNANYTIDISDQPIRSVSETVDLVFCVDRTGLKKYAHRVKDGGIVVHGDERHDLMQEFIEEHQKRGVKFVYLPVRQIAYSFGGNVLMTNMILLGLVWRTFGFKYEVLEEEVKERFASKPKLLEIDLKCLNAGYQAEGIEVPELKIPHPTEVPETILIEGNASLALGAVHCGVRAYYAYPMSPASSILTHLANWSGESGMLIKQAEDEITAVQMTIGSMFMGTRSFTATSGGGFDLMTESLTLPGMIESPLVVVIAQRPGPATGLPTWSSQGDLNLAIHAGHGEFPRVVLSCSDPDSCYELIQEAMNIAEEYQVPVVILTEKVICETKKTIPQFQQNKIEIKRGLVTDPKRLEELKPEDRYKITENGISERWLPGSSKTYYYANGDEHREDGTVTEDAQEVKAIYDKRMRKLETIKDALPEPEIFGTEKDADISVIGWGSTKNAMLDAIENLEKEGIKVNYLHYEYMWPLKTEKAKKFFEENKNVCLIEGNYNAQLGTMIEDKTGHQFKNKFLKYNGRNFYFDEIVSYLKNQIK
jgi:2-oxoglutarate ferredoxin oxidoreductase subunit alpha